MNRTLNPAERCPSCRMRRALCICALIPTLPTRTRIALLLHQLEVAKTTNTGLLALRCLPNSELVIRGRMPHGDAEEAQPVGPPPWQRAPERCVLLFPDEGARPIEAFRERPEPITLVVPDGTWSQALRARRRVPGLDRLPCAVVPGGAGRYRLRRPPRPEWIATLEAIARALGALEGAAVQESLERIFTIMVERTLWSRGRLSAAEVTGGIPAEAFFHGDARSRAEQDE